MKKTGVFSLLAAVILLFSLSSALADRSPVLDAALSMLEEGNPFLARYNEQTGAGIESRFPLGCPYFWGGRRVNRILESASPDQNSDYYRTDRQYLYGLDCAGFTRWVLEEAGFEPHDSIENLLNRSLYTGMANYRAAKNIGKERTRFLQVGDLLALRHASGGYHIAMYIGDLLDFGYTKKTLPKALVPWLYHPLVIYCTGSSEYHERYRAWLEENGRENVLPPYGGVIVSILDVPSSATTGRTPAVMDLGRPCFYLEGYPLEILDISRAKQERWIRWDEKRGE